MGQRNRNLRILIVDDSSFMRLTIRRILSVDPELEVVGVASDGVEGVEKALLLKPDVITMDVEMPRLNGIAALRKIMATAPSHIIMVSAHTATGAAATFDALEAGAVDYILKPDCDSLLTHTQFDDELRRKIRGAATIAQAANHPVAPGQQPSKGQHILPSRRIGYIGIGASTGGPVAVQDVLMSLPKTILCPLVIAVHMPKTFTGPFADRLREKCNLNVREAEDGDLLRSGSVYIAPGGVHTSFVRHSSGIIVKLSPAASYSSVYVPSIDLMMSSLADAASSTVLGIVLTGMGADGLKGLQHIKSRGGFTLVQDEATSIVFGMPKTCIEGGVVDEVLPVSQIAPAILRMTTE